MRREILHLSWPAILEMCLQMGVWMFDVAMVGRLGATPLSATAVSGQIYFGLMFLFQGIGVALTAIVARRVGEGRREEGARVGAQGLLLALGGGLFMTAFVWAVAPGVFTLTRLGAEASAVGVSYLRTICFGAPFLILGTAAAGILRGFGDTRTPMVVTAIVNAINVAGDWALIFGHLGFPALGARGAAVASATAQSLGGLIALYIILSGVRGVRVRPADVLPPKRGILAGIIRLAVPASAENFFTDLARTMGVFAVASLGTVAMAAHEVACTTEALSFMPGFGFCVAATIMVAQSLGSGDRERARAVVREASRIALIFMGSMGVVFFIFPESLVRVFTSDPEIIPLASQCLRVISVAQPLSALQGVVSGTLRGAGDTRSPMFIAATTSWTVRVFLTYTAIFFLHLPLPWVWGVMVLECGCRLLWLASVYRKGRWQNIIV